MPLRWGRQHETVFHWTAGYCFGHGTCICEWWIKFVYFFKLNVYLHIVKIMGKTILWTIIDVIKSAILVVLRWNPVKNINKHEFISMVILNELHFNTYI